MIKKLTIKNFLSLKNVALNLNQQNILVGPNMAGKSNLIEAMRFLSAIAGVGAKQAILDRDGFSEIIWKGKNDNRIMFELLVVLPDGPKLLGKIYKYSVSFQGSSSGMFVVEREFLRYKGKGSAVTLINLKNGHGSLRHADGSLAVRTPIDADKAALELNVPGWEGSVFRAWVAAWHYYRLVPTLMKQANAIRAQPYLTETGNNFSSWLNSLQTGYPEEFKRLRQVALDSLPGLSELLAPPTQFGTTIVSTYEKNLTGPISIWRMSDGELKFLALLSLIFSPAQLGAPVVCVEEPENHLHPKLIDALVEVYGQRTKELGAASSQAFITTHSPFLLDKASLDDLIVMSRSEGETICTRPSTKAHLKKLLAKQEVGLGDLWYSGALSDK